MNEHPEMITISLRRETAEKLVTVQTFDSIDAVDHEITDELLYAVITALDNLE